MSFDLIYIENMSLTLHLKILIYTVLTVIQGSGNKKVNYMNWFSNCIKKINSHIFTKNRNNFNPDFSVEHFYHKVHKEIFFYFVFFMKILCVLCD